MSDSEASAEIDLNAFHESNAFDMMMGSARKKRKADQNEPIRTAVVYSRRLVRIDPNHPLCGCIYGGQAVRADESPDVVAKARWGYENADAMRKNKRIGLLHELRMHGPEAFDNEVVESRRGPQSVVQKWANERERKLIASHGGPLRDPTVRCEQTLNLTNGGKCGCSFESMEAHRTACWKQFQDEIEEFIDIHKTSLVSSDYVNPVTGYKLGDRLGHVRRGHLWKGHSDEDERKLWLESLPNWAWNAKETEEYKAGCSERGKARFASPEARAEQSERAKKQRANETPEQRAEWSRKLSEAKSTPEAKAASSKRKKTEWANKTPEERAERNRKISETLSTPEAKAAASERGKAQFASPEARAELSERGKKQAAREAAGGKPSLAERGQTWLKNATPEQLAQRNRKLAETLSKTHANKRSENLRTLTGVELERKVKEYERKDRAEKIRKAKANALLKLEKYAGMNYTWRYHNVSKVQKEDGVHFFQDANGVWCAAFKTRGEGSSSSSAYGGS